MRAILPVLLVCVIALEPRFQGQNQPVFRAGAELVQIDVSARDENGQPVRGLSARDFTLVDRGEPAAIAFFEELSHQHAPPELPARFPREVADNRSGTSGRLVVLAIDDMIPVDRLTIVAGVAKSLVDRLGEDVSLALLTSSGARDVEVTQNRAELFAQIDALHQRSARAPRVARTTRNETGDCNFEMFRRTAVALDSADTRRKAVIYISPYCSTDLKEIVRTMSPGSGDRSNTAAQMIDALRRANVSFYAIDPRGVAGYSVGNFPVPNLMGTPGPEGIQEWRSQCTLKTCDPVLLSQDNLRAVTEATGGFAITNSDDLESGAARIIDDLDHYYVLGFYPASPPSTDYRRVNVTVGRAKVTLRFRRGYRLDPRSPSVSRNSEAVKGTRELERLNESVMPTAGLGLTLVVVPEPTNGRPVLLLSLGVSDVLPAATSAQSDDVAISVIAVDLKSKKIARRFSLTRSVRLPPTTGSPGGRIHYRLLSSLELPKGLYQIRVAARSDLTGHAGSVYSSVAVPDYRQAPFQLGGLIVATDESMIPVVVDKGLPPIALSFNRVFERGKRLQVLARINTPNGAELRVSVSTIDDRGTETTITHERLAQPRTIGDGKYLDLEIDLTPLQPGPYRLRVTASAGKQRLTREVSVAVR